MSALNAKEEELITIAIHYYAKMWGSTKAKRTTVEKALERKPSRGGYGITDGIAKIDAMIKAGKLQEKDGFLLDPHPEASQHDWGKQ